MTDLTSAADQAGLAAHLPLDTAGGAALGLAIDAALALAHEHARTAPPDLHRRAGPSAAGRNPEPCVTSSGRTFAALIDAWHQVLAVRRP